MKTFPLEIISPEGIKYEGEAESVTVHTKTGQLTILAKHTPLFTVLEPGELKIRTTKGQEFYSIGGGFLEVSAKKVLVLADKALHVEEIDEEKVLEAQKRAEEILRQKPKGEIHINAKAAFRRSLIDLKIAQRRKKRQTL